MAEKRPAKPGGLSSREKEPAALPPTGSTTASRFRTTGSSGQRLISERRSEHQSYSSTDEPRLQVSDASVNAVKNVGRRHTHNVEVIPEPKAVLVSPAHSKTERISKPPAPPPTSADVPGTKMSSVQIRVGSTRPGRAERVTSPSDGEESKKRQVSLSPPMSPPLSPTVDDTTVKHKPPTSSRYKPLPDQAFPIGATGTSATKGSSKSSAKGTTGLSANKPSPLDLKAPSSPSAQHLSLPSPSSTTSSGNLSSGGIFSEGLSSGEHMIAQAHSLDGRARVVGGAGLGKSSLDINPRNYKPTKEHHQPSIATEGADAPRVSTQASDGPSEDASAENEQCRDKMLLATNSIGMSTCGRPVLKSSVSDETGALNGRLQYDSKVKDLKARMSQLEATNSELKERNSVLEQQLNDHPPASDRQEGDSFEQGYTHRQEFDRLIGEVNRLSPFEGEVARLKKEIKVLDERYEQAKGLEVQLIEQVSLVSLKDAEIATLKQQRHARYEQTVDSKGGRDAEITRLTAELDSKTHENARLKARLKKSEKSRSADYDSMSADPSSSADAIRADYEQELKDQETMISSLRKQGVQEAVGSQLLRDAVAVASGSSKEHSAEQHPGEKSSAASKSSTSNEERELAIGDEASQEVIKSLVRAVTERDRRIKMLSDQLQHFMKTAANVEKISRHAKEQSEKISQLKSQLQVGHEDSVSQPHSHPTEYDALLLKHEESLLTIRRFSIQLKKLEEENKRLKAEAHGYANTKLDDVEKDNKSLREEVDQRETKIVAMNVKLNELSTQNKACEEKILAMHHTLKSLEGSKHHLEQKDVAQQALLQNLQQELDRTKERASENAVTVQKRETEIRDQSKQIQDLLGEIQAAKAMAAVYQEDFNNERKDRESAHAKKNELEERFKAEVAHLKEQVQRVSADNGRLLKVMKDKEGQLKSEISSLKQQIEEKNKNCDALKAEMIVLEDDVQSKTQQVKQYKKQIDQLKKETDRYRQDMTAFLQQAEHHKQQIENTVKEKEHLVHQSRLLQGETERLNREIGALKAREHLAQHGALSQRQQSAESSPISVEDFMKERRKCEDAVRIVRRLEKQVEELLTDKAILISEKEDLQRHFGQTQPTAGLSHPPSVSDMEKPPAYPGYRAQGGSALPTPMRPMLAQQRLNPASKSASVDSPDILNPRGHCDPPSSNPRSQVPVYGNHQRPQQQRHQGRRSHTSTIETPQRDYPFQSAQSNAHVTRGSGGGYPFASTDDINVMTNADGSGGHALQPVMGSPPTNAKLPPPPRSIANAAKSASSSRYAPRPPPPVVQQQHNQPQYGQHSTRQVPPTYSQSSGGGSSGVPPFMAHAHGQSVQSHGPMRATSAASVQQQHYIDLARQQHISPPPPDEGSGHQSLPSFGSGSFTEQADRVLSPDLVPRPSRDDTYLPKQQRQVPPELQPRYHPAFDVIEKDSSPPTSMGPVMHAGQPLSLNPQAVNQGLSAPPPRHQRRSHQMPLSPEHSKLRMDFSGIDRSRIVRPDCSEPSSKNGRSAMQANRQQPAVRGPVQVSSKGSTHNRPAPAVYVYGGGNAPELDSDPASQVSFESGCGSPIGGSQVNLNENTLERGIDRDIRRAASNVKKEIGGQGASAGAKGRSDMAPYDPNLVCPSCGVKFRIGEIQKFKRHASTCTGT